MDIYTEIYLWNKNIDSLIRVVQHLEFLGIGPSLLKTPKLASSNLFL